MTDDPASTVSVPTVSVPIDSAEATAPADETPPLTEKRMESPSTTDAAAVIINTADSSNNLANDDNYMFMKDLLYSLPAMEQRKLENIVQQSSLLLSNTRDDDSSVWKERIIDPFWLEYQTRTCRLSDPEIPVVTSKPPGHDTEHISHLRTQIQDYQTSQYGEKHYATANFHITAVSTTEIMLRTYVEYIDTANCSTASWQVEWTIQMVDDITAILSGTIRLHTHYYENNTNSQMQCQQEFVKHHTVSLTEEKVNSLVAQFEKNTLSYAEKLVTQIVKYIIRKEEDYYTTMIDHILCNSNGGESESTAIPDQLRSLRRILPVTKQKFAWHRNSTHTQQQQLQQLPPMTIQQQMMQQMQNRKNQLPK